MDFHPFPKMARLSREVVITEKLDGTNAQVCISEDGSVFAGSRTRWITPQDDNFGFAAWVRDNEDDLRKLGPGRHFGEWWGRGIQRNYGLPDRRFSLFNVTRWALHGTEPQHTPTGNPNIFKVQDVLPACCGLVPVLWRGIFDTFEIETAIQKLAFQGSVAAPGFMEPEGVVVYHEAGGVGFKKLIENDDIPKGLVYNGG